MKLNNDETVNIGNKVEFLLIGENKLSMLVKSILEFRGNPGFPEYATVHLNRDDAIEMVNILQDYIKRAK